MAFPFSGARIAITGAGGFIGRAVQRLLIDVDATPVPILGPGVSTIAGARQGDLTNRRFVTEAFANVDGVIHLAARSGGVAVQGDTSIYETNRAITAAVFDGAVACGITRMFAASSAVVYQVSNQPLLESDPLLPDEHASAYALSKIDDERDGIARTATGELDVVFGRFGNVIGPLPHDVPARTTVVYDLIRKARTGHLDVWGDGTAVRSFIHVDDVAAAILAVFSGGNSGEVYNIDTGVEVQMSELATTIRDLVNPAAEIVFDPTKPTGPGYRVLSAEKLQRLGFSCQYTWAEALTDSIPNLST